ETPRPRNEIVDVHRGYDRKRRRRRTEKEKTDIRTDLRTASRYESAVSARHEAIARRTWSGVRSEMGQRTEKSVVDGYDVPRCASIATCHPCPHERFGANR